MSDTEDRVYISRESYIEAMERLVPGLRLPQRTLRAMEQEGITFFLEAGVPQIDSSTWAGKGDDMSSRASRGCGRNLAVESDRQDAVAAKRYLLIAEFFFAAMMAVVCLLDAAVYGRHLWWSGWSPEHWPGWSFLGIGAVWFCAARYEWRKLGY